MAEAPRRTAFYLFVPIALLMTVTAAGCAPPNGECYDPESQQTTSAANQDECEAAGGRWITADASVVGPA